MLLLLKVKKLQTWLNILEKERVSKCAQTNCEMCLSQVCNNDNYDLSLQRIEMLSFFSKELS